MKTRERGFTLVEIMIVVAVIGLLAAIAIPNFANARQTAIMNVCKANAKQIQDALDVAAVSPGGGFSTTNLGADAIRAVIFPDYVKSMPVCEKGVYSTDENGNVVCSYHNSSTGGRIGSTLSGR